MRSLPQKEFRAMVEECVQSIPDEGQYRGHARIGMALLLAHLSAGGYVNLLIEEEPNDPR